MNEVALDRLSDHDLLLRIAVQVECLPELERRLRSVETDVTRLKVQGGIVAVVVTAISSVIGALLPGRP